MFLNKIILVILIIIQYFSICEASIYDRDEIIQRFGNETPQKFGMHLDGVVDRIVSVDEFSRKTIALTFDLCGGKAAKIDEKLIKFLIQNEILATFFLSSSWIDARSGDVLVKEMISAPFFEIENHGTRHVPLSVIGRSAYRVRGTRSVEEVFDEVEINARKIKQLTGKEPLFFRSGAAHYDDVSVRIVNAMGYNIAGFSINGDEGATASARKVRKNILAAKGGEIVLCHANRPGSGTADGVIAAVNELKQRGFVFITLGGLRN
ncbi:MAG: polysaccharide deacetylase family protein [Synergistaceae bacterium]|nr:polysaccharide deacetylase family protein [Synergistaceae bacterium]